MIPAAELAFAAGLMEGEGTVLIAHPQPRQKGCLVVSCTNTDSDLIEFLQTRWPGYCKPVAGLRPPRRQALVWTIAARQALAFLEEIEPYVVSARMRDRIATARWWQQIKAKHWRYRTDADCEEAFSCYLWMRELNVRGVA